MKNIIKLFCTALCMSLLFSQANEVVGSSFVNGLLNAGKAVAKNALTAGVATAAGAVNPMMGMGGMGMGGFGGMGGMNGMGGMAMNPTMIMQMAQQNPMMIVQLLQQAGYTFQNAVQQAMAIVTAVMQMVGMMFQRGYPNQPQVMPNQMQPQGLFGF